MEITIAMVTSKSEASIHYSCGTQMLEVDPHFPVSMIGQIRLVQDLTPVSVMGSYCRRYVRPQDKTADALMAPVLQSRHISPHLYLHSHAQDR